MHIGIIDEFREKQMTGINRVVCGTLEELIKRTENTYSFLGQTHYLPIKIDEISLFFDKGKEIDLNFLLLSHKMDVVHSFYRAYRFNEKIHCAKVLTIHDLIMLTHPEVATQAVFNYFDGPLRRCARAADIIFADSESTKKDIIDYYKISEDKIEVVYPGLYPRTTRNLIAVSEKWQRLEKEKFILSVSGLTVYKNQLGLIKAFRVFMEKHPESDLKLVITGPPRMRMEEIYDELRKLKYGDSVIFTGYVSEKELIWLYQNCLVYTSVSWYEGFGLTILEALNQGKAVICSNTTSMPEVGGDAVEYCNPFDIESIECAIERVVLDDNRRRYLEKKSIAQAEKFSYKIAAEKIMNEYEKLV